MSLTEQSVLPVLRPLVFSWPCPAFSLLGPGHLCLGPRAGQGRPESSSWGAAGGLKGHVEGEASVGCPGLTFLSQYLWAGGGRDGGGARLGSLSLLLCLRGPGWVLATPTPVWRRPADPFAGPGRGRSLGPFWPVGGVSIGAPEAASCLLPPDLLEGPRLSGQAGVSPSPRGHR